MRDVDNKWIVLPSGRSSGGMIWLMGQIFFIPMRTFVYGMGMIVEAMRGLQQAGDRGIEVVAGGQAAGEAPVAASQPTTEITDSNQPAAPRGTEKSKEESNNMDQTLNNDKVKLVRYKILSLKRDEEKVIVKDGEDVVTDNIEDSSYIAWKIAQHCNETGKSAVEDGKYLRVYFEVLASYERQKEEDQVKVLKQIRDNLGGVRDNIGGIASKG